MLTCTATRTRVHVPIYPLSSLLYPAYPGIYHRGSKPGLSFSCQASPPALPGTGNVIPPACTCMTQLIPSCLPDLWGRTQAPPQRKLNSICGLAKLAATGEGWYVYRQVNLARLSFYHARWARGVLVYLFLYYKTVSPRQLINNIKNCTLVVVMVTVQGSKIWSCT